MNWIDPRSGPPAALPPAAASPGAASSPARLAAATILVGIGAGLGGMALALLLHLIQHLAYGYGLSGATRGESFLDGVRAAAPARKLAVLALCGIVAGGGWWAVYRFGAPLVSIRKAVRRDDARMPLGATLGHALLQIATVALGSPLGREVAPREVGAAYAGWLARRLGLTPDETRLMIACGAGAGLAAVYNVPLAGTLFVLEVLLGTTRPGVAIPALASCVIAALVAWTGLGDGTQYTLHLHFSLDAGLVLLSSVTGPAFGAAAFGFVRLVAACRARAPKDRLLLAWCLPVFIAIGLVSIWFPGLLGNGRGPIQSGLDDEVNFSSAWALLVLKLLAIAGALRAGAEGGLLTPGMTIGALMAILFAGVWDQVLPSLPIETGAFVIIGGAAFLAASMQMPVTAIVLALEFTGISHDLLFPVLLATVGSMAGFTVLERGTAPGIAARMSQLVHAFKRPGVTGAGP